ncbi:hypothetical protein HPP92_022669 [Vanilla planifolia]|uniref:Uncharacterized protein n=1 Tax=Vanilla planifolia TaxID=51239 RepID=A0A835PW41_VANPL|nr:hypothetical protein HPP92_022669 [Vanilla planifolia]
MKGALVVIAGSPPRVVQRAVEECVPPVMVNREAARSLGCVLLRAGVGVTVGPDPRLVDRELGPRFRAVTWAEYRQIEENYFKGAID